MRKEALARGHDEATADLFTAITLLLNWQTHQFCEQGLGQEADLRMARHHSCQWTTIPPDDVGTVVLFKFCQATERIEDGDRCFEPGIQFSSRGRPLGHQTAARRTQER